MTAALHYIHLTVKVLPTPRGATAMQHVYVQ